MLELVKGCGLFNNMNDESITNCLNSFNFRSRKIYKEQMIVQANDDVLDQIILISGTVKSVMSDFSGKIIKIADISAPRILAPAFLFGKSNKYPVSIFATTDCDLLLTSKNDFQNSLLNNNQLQINFINLISEQTQFLTRKINFLKLKTIKAKIAHFLLNQQIKQNSLKIKLPQSQTQLADLFGVTRPSLSRELMELQLNGIINIEGKFIEILDNDGLRKLI